jgi:nucleotide-binding universal stress UspA family protein
MGASSDFSLRASHTTSLIVKDNEPSRPSSFVIGIDGSTRAEQALELALRLRAPEDHLYLIHIEDLAAQAGSARQFDADVVEAKYTETARGISNATFRRVVKPKSESVADAFIRITDEVGGSYVLVGVDGMGNFCAGKPVSLGSVSDKVIKTSRANVIAVHPPKPAPAASATDATTPAPTPKS